MRVARLIFQIAGIYGLIVVVPLFFLEGAIDAATPPAITHPEYYYGFACVTLAWQVLFLVVARDPVRYRALMPVAMLEKITGVVFIALVLLHRAPSTLLLLGSSDVCLGIAFLIAYRQTAPGSTVQATGASELPQVYTGR
jgi:hypothetical protein